MAEVGNGNVVFSENKAAEEWPQISRIYTDFWKTDLWQNWGICGEKFFFDNQRRKTILSQPGSGNKTKYFFGNYEIHNDDTGEKTFLFVNSPVGLCAIIESYEENQVPVEKVWHTCTDHLGSLVYLENADNSSETLEYSYDCWGNPRKVSDWLDSNPIDELIADRGYTGHEHLVEFGLINMNGRVYDPKLGRFLSPDPFVQAPHTVGGFNRYTYCYNNPLKYTDPSGYIADPFWIGGFEGAYDRPWPHKKGGRGGENYQGVFPKIGIFGGPRNDFEYDMMQAIRMDAQMGGNAATMSILSAANFKLYPHKDIVQSGFVSVSNKSFSYHSEYDSDEVMIWLISALKGDISGVLPEVRSVGSFEYEYSLANSGAPGPQFSGSFWDWANKINHGGRRKWDDPESGMSYYINDAGEITGVYPVTGMAPTPGKGYSKGMYNAFFNQLQQHGLKSILKSQAKIQSRLNAHLQALDEYTKAGGFTSSVQREINTFKAQLKAIEDLLNSLK